MLANPIMFMTAGLMLTVGSAEAAYRFDAGSVSVAVPRWVPYGALAALAIASAVVGVMFPETLSASFGGGFD